VHEFGIADQILATVLARAGERRVAAVTVRAGVRHGIVAESMELAFDHAATGTPAEGATIAVVPLPAKLRCRHCGAECPTFDVIGVCPQCGDDDVSISGGDELTLESIEYAAAPV